MQRLLSLCLIALATLASACGNTAGPAKNEVGTYGMESINANPLPTDFGGVRVLSGTLTLHEDNNYTTMVTVRGTDGFGQPVTQTQTEVGSYTRTQDSLHFIPVRGHESSATFSGETITVKAGLVSILYRRR